MNKEKQIIRNWLKVFIAVTIHQRAYRHTS
jgi:hypothetical protein